MLEGVQLRSADGSSADLLAMKKRWASRKRGAESVVMAEQGETHTCHLREGFSPSMEAPYAE